MDDEPSTLEQRLKTQPKVVEDTSETMDLGRDVASLTLFFLVASLFADVSVYVMIAATWRLSDTDGWSSGGSKKALIRGRCSWWALARRR